MPAAKPPTNPRKAAARPARAELVMTTSRARNTVRVKLGDVTVIAPKPTRAQVEQGIRDSNKAMNGLCRRLLKPGVVLEHGPDVPVFHADPENPQRIIRTLHGKSEGGRVVRGKFKPD